MGRRSKKSRPNRSKTSCNSIVNIYKNNKMRKKDRNKSNHQIRKLFNQLHSDSDITISSCDSLNNTVIQIDNSHPNVETSLNKPNTPSHSLVIIDDEDLTSNGLCPLQCSTPYSSKHNLNKKVSTEGQTNNNTTQNFNKEVENLTREINPSSYLTIDLTTDGLNLSTEPNTVIDLVNTTNAHDCTILDDTFSMSGDSDVTVVNTNKGSGTNKREMKKFANGIAKLDSSERGKLLEYIANKIFNGCKKPITTISSLQSIKKLVNRATETVEDTYIKEVILGKASRNSIGSNIYNPEKDINNKSGLRMIVIDGSNVAMQHTKGRIFSVKGLKICIDYFIQRGHTVKAFVPHFRCKLGKSTDGKLLDQLERQGLVVYTPSREVQGRMIMSYDDRYIVQCAAEFDGVIVSSDYYRDLLSENPKWRRIIENRLLQFTWVGDMIMFPRDPLGRNGPTLEQFLKHPS